MRSHRGSASPSLAIFFCVLLLAAGSAVAETKERRILIVLNSLDVGAWEQEYLRAYQEEIDRAPNVSITIEFLGLDFFEPNEFGDLASLIAAKYKSHSFDLVISTLPQSASFLYSHGATILPGTPRLYVAPALSLQPELQGQPNAAILPSAWDTAVVETTALIPLLFPNKKHLLVAAGSGGEDSAYLARTQRQFDLIKPPLDIEYSVGEDPTQIARRAKENTVILLLTHEKDRTGLHHTITLPPKLNEMTDAPVFGLYSDLIGSGVVGGIMTATEAYGRVSASMSLDILDGSIADVESGSPVIPMFDAEQLERFSIEVTALPDDARVINQELSLWETHQITIILVATIMLAQLLLIFLLMRALTARRRTEQLLQDNYQEIERQSQMFKSVIDAIPDAIVLVDGDNHILTANHPGLETTLGISPDDVLGRPLSDLCLNPEWLTESPLNVDETQLVKRLDGSEIIAETSRIPLNEENSPAYAFLLYIRDKTEKTLQEQEHRRTQKLDSLGQLAGGIAHDFNNLLAVIMGNAELAVHQKNDPQGVEENISHVLSATESARSLVGQILRFSRDTSTGAHEQFSMTDLLNNTQELLEASLPSRIKLEHNIEPGLSVMGDQSQLQSVIINLVTNATHAIAANGNITISGRKYESDTPIGLFSGTLNPGKYVQIAVDDDGHGISNQVIDKIFEPFFTTKNTGEGTGLGLAMAYGVVTTHGGQLDVESQEGHGTTLTMYLPLEVSINETREENPQDHYTGNGRRVLLIDDDQLVLSIEGRMLELMGFEVSAFSDADDALTAVLSDASHFDLVITDQTMPKVLGSTVAQTIRDKFPEMPVFIATGLGTLPGGKSFPILKKPFSLRELAEVFADHL